MYSFFVLYDGPFVLLFFCNAHHIAEHSIGVKDPEGKKGLFFF